MKIVTFANRKGGVGKTTTAFNYGWFLASEGKKVCFIDLDSQCNLTSLFSADPCALDEFKKGEILEVNSRVDLLPGTKAFPQLEDEINREFDRYEWLRSNIIKRLSGYDFIVIDTSPSLSILNMNAFMISDLVHIVINPDTFSYIGLQEMKEILEKIQTRNTGLSYHITLNADTGDRVLNRKLNNALKREPAFTGIRIPQRQHITDQIARKKPAFDRDDIRTPFLALAEV
jgi:cellulose biosynthesis protein BcsQ